MSSCCDPGANIQSHQGEGGKADPKKERYISLQTVIIIFLAIGAAVWKSVMIVQILIVLVVAGVVYYITDGSSISGPNPLTEMQEVGIPAAAGDEILFSESTFADGKAHVFDHNTPEGKKIRYFVIKSSDGIIRAAFDACDVCWRAGKGYYQKGDFMVCRKCGREFQSTNVNTVTDGCNPAALSRFVRNGNVAIPIRALDEGRQYFN